MFEFLVKSEIVHLIESFMHKWYAGDENEELRRGRLRREHDEKRKQMKLSMEAAAAEIDEAEFEGASIAPKMQVQDTKSSKLVAEVVPPTIAQMSEGTGLSHEQIRQTIKDAEDQFVHWPHPKHPDMTRYALREHAERLGLENWQPGVGF